jgi:hypothetical protein
MTPNSIYISKQSHVQNTSFISYCNMQTAKAAFCHCRGQRVLPAAGLAAWSQRLHEVRPRLNRWGPCLLSPQMLALHMLWPALYLPSVGVSWMGRPLFTSSARVTVAMSDVWPWNCSSNKRGHNAMFYARALASCNHAILTWARQAVLQTEVCMRLCCRLDHLDGPRRAEAVARGPVGAPGLEAGHGGALQLHQRLLDHGLVAAHKLIKRMHTQFAVQQEPTAHLKASDSQRWPRLPPAPAR